MLGIGLAATRDIVSFFRHDATDAAGTSNPVAGPIAHAISDWRLAIRQLHQDLHAPRVQSGSRRPDRVGWRVPAHCRAADADQLPLRAARRCRDPLRARQRAGGVVGPLCGQDARPAGGQPARSLRCDADLSEDDRSLRLDRVLGVADVARTDGTDAEPTFRFRTTCAATTTGHDARRGTRRLRIEPRQAAQAGCALPANPNPEPDTTRALTARADCLGRAGTPPPPSRYPRLDRGELVEGTLAAVACRACRGSSLTARRSTLCSTTTSARVS